MGRGSSGAGSGIATEAPPLKESWKERLSEGRALAEAYPGKSYNAAVDAAARENYDLIEPIISDAAEYTEKTAFIREQFFKAGFYGDKPEYVHAVRYGDIPESGRSINWAENSNEQGVSVVRIIRKKSDLTDSSIYDVTQGWQGIQRYEVAGWFLGRTGADGEPLLVDAKVVRKL